MKTAPGKFLQMPNTQMGWSAVGLALVFVAMFLLTTNDLIHFSGIFTLAIGVLAGVLTLLALTWRRERSWLLWLMLLPGLFAILFSLGEVLFPH
jgi:hypothetical protein